MHCLLKITKIIYIILQIKFQKKNLFKKEKVNLQNKKI
jgi:hypothetical protein